MDEEVVTALKRVAKGSVFVLFGFAVYSIGIFLFRALSARGLPIEDFGVLSFLLSLTTTASIIATLGIVSGLPKFIVEHRVKGRKAGELIGSAFLLTLLSSVLTSLLLLLAYPFVQTFVGVDFSLYTLFSLSVIFFAILMTSVGADRGFGNYVVKAFFSDGLRGIILGIGGLLIYYTGILLLAGVSYFLAFLLPSVLAFVYVYRRYSPKPSTIFLKELAVFSVSLLFVAFLVRTMLSTDVLMLSYFLPEREVGLYGSAQTLSVLGTSVHNAILFLFFPFVTSFFARKMFSKADRFYKLVTKWVLALSLPLFSILFFYAPQTLTIVFGREYSPASGPLRILSLGYLVHVFLGANGASLISLGYIADLTTPVLLSLFINLLLNVLLIPRLGIVGAAVATALSLIFLNLFMSYVLWKRTGVHPLYGKLLVPVASTGTALLLSYLLSYLSPLLQLTVFLVTYTIFNILLGVFEEEDREILRTLKRKLLS